MHGITGFYWFTHTCTQTYTHAQTVKLQSSDKLNFMYLPLNYVNNVGMTEFTEFNVKQVANRPCSPPQSPGPSSHEWSSWSTP